MRLSCDDVALIVVGIRLRIGFIVSSVASFVELLSTGSYLGLDSIASTGYCILKSVANLKESELV